MILKVISIALTPSIYETFITMRARVVVIPVNGGHTTSLLGKEVAAGLWTVWKRSYTTESCKKKHIPSQLEIALNSSRLLAQKAFTRFLNAWFLFWAPLTCAPRAADVTAVSQAPETKDTDVVFPSEVTRTGCFLYGRVVNPELREEMGEIRKKIFSSNIEN